jgi:ribosomal protein S18 acetylase RimI-like enzyme
VPDFALLDNPIWHALTSVQAPLARGTGLARCYPPDVSPLSGIAEPSAAAFADLRDAVAERQRIALFSPEPLEIPGDWRVLRSRFIDQMVCLSPRTKAAPADFVELGEPDVPEMLALTALTEPGPFLPATIRMGRYIGIRVDGRLAAMAGQRLRLDEFTEVSAVCTHPDFRGRGYAAAVMTPLIERVFSEGRTPLLHVKTENAAAKSVYERLGFSIRRPIHFAVLTPA